MRPIGLLHFLCDGHFAFATAFSSQSSFLLDQLPIHPCEWTININKQRNTERASYLAVIPYFGRKWQGFKASHRKELPFDRNPISDRKRVPGGKIAQVQIKRECCPSEQIYVYRSTFLSERSKSSLRCPPLWVPSSSLAGAAVRWRAQVWIMANVPLGPQLIQEPSLVALYIIHTMDLRYKLRFIAIEPLMPSLHWARQPCAT